MRHHARLQRLQQLLGFAAQQCLGVHVGRIGLGRDELTQGPVQRLIWYSRQGRVRLANTVSSQVRRRNTFCSSWMVSFTAQALG
jgi:hypothetical protein